MRSPKLPHVVAAFFALAACSSGGVGKTPSGGSSSGSSGGSTSSGSSSGGSSSAGSDIGIACTIDLITSGPGLAGDPCLLSGLVCDGPYTGTDSTAQNGTCELPVEYQSCAANPGCATTPIAYSCFTFPAQGYSQCLQGCTDTAGCNDATDSCTAAAALTGGAADGGSYCYYGICGPGSGKYLASGEDNGAFYGPCTVVTGNDGYCVPEAFSNATLGLCHPTGSAATNAACTTDRPLSGAPAFCVAGDICETSLTATSPTDQGYCLAVCGAAIYPGELDGGAPASDGGTDGGAPAPGPGPSCASGDSCGLLFSYDYWGVCGTACNPANNAAGGFANAACAAPDPNCYSNLGRDAGWCAP